MAPTKIVEDGGKVVIEDGGKLSLEVVDPTAFGTFAPSGVTTDTRSSSWGGGGSGSIDNIYNLDFNSAEELAVFFNTGGEVRLDLSHPTGTAQDNDWNASLGTRLGQVQFDIDGVATTGTSGFSSGVGFNDLTTEFQTILDATDIGTGAYSTNDVLIEARLVGDDTVQIRVTLTDQHTNAFFDTVASGTQSVYSVLKMTAPNVAVTPTGSYTNTFD